MLTTYSGLEGCIKLVRVTFVPQRSSVKILMTLIIVRDSRQKYFSQNYYHFPEGIFYLFDRLKNEALGKPEFEITFDGQIKTNRYQIGIAYRTDWHPAPSIASFANDITTINGGTLVAGIYEGLISGCKKYVRENKLKNYRIEQKKFVNGLILVCAVRGKNFEFGGSFKESLLDKEVKEQIKNEIAKLAADYLKNNKEKGEKFLWRFDKQQLGSAMF